MSNKTKLVRREELSYLQKIVAAYDDKKRNAKREAMLIVQRQVESERKELARIVWESKQLPGVTVADIEAASGLSRPTVYRLLEEHAENSGGEPGALISLMQQAKRQKRFTYDGITEGDVIWVIDTENENKREPLAFDPYYSEWVHQTLGKRGSHWWDKVPELELTVEAIRAGEFIPESDLPEVLESVLVQIDTEAARAELEARKSGKATKSEAKPEVEEDMAFEDPLVWE